MKPAGRRWLDVAVPVALVVGTLATRLPRLSTPRAFIFDEIYYAPDAAEMLRIGIERGGVVHPPGGKWLIAGGIRVFGMTPVGWRMGAVVAGTLVVLLTYFAARQFVAGHAIPALAGAAVALDGVSFTTGRTAHLDVFLALFTMAAITFTLAALRDPENERRVRWCMVGAAVALGLGLAVKWSAGFLLLGVLLAFIWMQSRRSERRHNGRTILVTVLTLTVVPVAIYVAAYTPWLVNFDKTYIHLTECRTNDDCGTSLTDRFRLFYKDQQRVREFQQTSLQDTNSNADLSWKWVSQTHPSTLFRKTCISALDLAPENLTDNACDEANEGDVMEIVTVANPVVWFSAMAAGLLLIWRAVFRRDRMAFFLLAFGLYQWFPWALNPRHSYTFYLAPLIPAVVLWLAYAFTHRPFKWVAPVFAVLAVAAFAFYYPIWAGVPMSPDQIHAREYWRSY